MGQAGNQRNPGLFVAVFGYGLALGFTVSVFLKPFMPSKFGWWSGPEGFGITIPEQMHELLGNYFVPVIAAAAFISAVATTHLLRWMMRKRTPGLSIPAESHSTLDPVARQQPIMKVGN